MRTSILLWSTFSGVVIGILADAGLVAVALVVSYVAPASVGRLMQARWVIAIGAAVLALVLVIGAVLGYLEGELKTV